MARAVDLLKNKFGVSQLYKHDVIKDEEVINWIAEQHKETEITMSICSGSRFLALIGALNNNPYCTHHQVYDDMKKLVPSGIPIKDKRFTQANEKTYTSGGISAGIDLSFHIIYKLHDFIYTIP